MLQCLKKYEFNLLKSDISIEVSWKFELFIFKIALVIKNYIGFAFLFVQTVCGGVKMLKFPD